MNVPDPADAKPGGGAPVTPAQRATVVVGVLLVLVGLLWVGQGAGLVGGSFMSGQAIWAVIGAVAIFFGSSLLMGFRRSRKGQGLGDEEAD